MRLNPILQYLLKYYRQNKIKLFVSLLCLTICYLSFEIVISFSSIIENNSQKTFQIYFKDASFIIAPPTGIIFNRNGQLSISDSVSPSILDQFRSHFGENDYSLISDSNAVSFIVIRNKLLVNKLKMFCSENGIKILSSFYTDHIASDNRNLMYDVNGIGNKFNLFSFENQISAFILGSELSSKVGMISRLVSIFSVVFTFYISLLYFQERKNEFSTLIIQGYTDKNIAIIFIDCVLQNTLAFLFSFLFLGIIVNIFTTNSSDFITAIYGLIYILPYLPVLIIIQLLLLLNKSVKYASNF